MTVTRLNVMTGEIETIDEDVPAFESVVPFPILNGFQFRAMLDSLGVLEQAAALAQAAGGLIWLAWEYGSEFNRNSPTIQTLAPQLGLNDPAVIDGAWRAAAQIRV